jgi:hypothetical protein
VASRNSDADYSVVIYGASIKQLVKQRTCMQKVVSLKHARPYKKLARSTGRLTASVSLVVILVQLEGWGIGDRIRIRLDGLEGSRFSCPG